MEYTAVCVGGPCDQQYVCNHSPWLLAVVHEPFAAWDNYSKPPTGTITIPTVEYKYTEYCDCWWYIFPVWVIEAEEEESLVWLVNLEKLFKFMAYPCGGVMKAPEKIAAEAAVSSKPWVSIIRRESGLLEQMCVHGTGHPVYGSADWQAIQYNHSRDDSNVWLIHGCCGCCSDPEWQKESLKESVRWANDLIIKYKQELDQYTN